MIVGRNYHGSPQRPPDRRICSEKHGPRSLPRSQSVPEQPRCFGWRPASYEDHVADWRRAEERRRISAKTQEQQTFQPAVDEDSPRELPSASAQDEQSHSTPLSIPRRGRSGVHAQIGAQHKRSQGHTKASSRTASSESRTLPSHVASLLGSTAIPKKKSFPRRRTIQFQRMSSDELVDHWRQLDLEDDLVSSDPTMEVLLSPPETGGFVPRTVSYESFARSTRSSSRSSSSDSIPSLDGETSSIVSWSVPGTPRPPPSKRVSSGATTPKATLSSPPSIECLQHPLLVQHNEEDAHYDTAVKNPLRNDTPTFEIPRHRPEKRWSPPSAKSTLTMSLKAIRSAARSFSNFAAPSLSVLPDDHLSRGLFGSQGQHPAFPAEMRPRQVSGVPTSAMRRYLNPSHSTVPGDFHLHGASWDHLDLEAVAARVPIIDQNGYVVTATTPPVIKMQTYVRVTPTSPRHSSRSALPDLTTRVNRTVRLSASMPSTADPFLQTTPPVAPNRPRREPRENADFLRVCVLEMSMRRAGKLEAVAIGGVGAGKAKFWLPPRTDGTTDDEEPWQEMETVMIGKRRVPRRWVGVAAC